MGIPRIVLCVLLLALLLSPATADWREEDLPKDLEEAAIARLVRDKVLLSETTVPQVFSPYIDLPLRPRKLPVFVTSDTVLAAYQVLLEDSLTRLERARLGRLRAGLAATFRRLPAVAARSALPADALTNARRRARLVLATAILLCGDEPPDLDQEEAALAAEAAAAVVAAEGTGKPAWLGPPDPGFTAIDWGRCRPRGFYTESDSLRRLFRATMWLMAIPFRVGEDSELLPFLLLLRAAREAEATDAFRGYERLLGRGDESSLADAELPLVDVSTLEAFRATREAIREAAREPRIHDGIAIEPVGKTLRPIAASRTPDGVLFHRVANETEDGPMPSGLMVAGMLGDAAAAARCDPEVRERILEAVAEIDTESLYGRALLCLAGLLDEPPPGAPEFMAGAAWKTKSRRTALAGWSLLRHAWVLPAKPSAFYFSLTDSEPGFVEPDPAFFLQFARLCEGTLEMLRSEGAFDPFQDRLELADEISRFLRWLSRLAPKERSDFDFWLRVEESGEVSSRALRLAELGGPSGGFEDWTNEDWEGVTGALIATTRRLGDRDDPAPLGEDSEAAGLLAPGTSGWNDLAELANTLGRLAAKQLAGTPFDESEQDRLRHFGEDLAKIMLYGGNSYLAPRDDAPRIADVHLDPRAGRRLLVGTGRPRILYVLWPGPDGEEILCRGAALTYYELENDRPLTDAEWKARLDSEDPPRMPDWVR